MTLRKKLFENIVGKGKSAGVAYIFSFFDDSNCEIVSSLIKLTIVTMMVMWESSQWLAKNILQSTVKPMFETTCIKRLPALRDHSCDTTTLLKAT